ncbi:MAG: DMT family transporter [Paracoccaceae bacterium]
MLLAVGTGWGSSQSTGKLAVSTGHGPFGVIFWQLAISTGLLGLLVLWRRRPVPLHRQALRFYLAVALLGTLLPNMTFYLSVRHLPAGVMSIVISLVPMLALPMSVALGLDRITPRRLTGLGLGVLGVAIIAASGGAVGSNVAAGWLAVAVLGPVLYAMEGTYVARTGTAGTDAVTAMFGASALGMALCLPLALASGQWVSLAGAWGVAEWALLLQSVLHAALYVSYVWLAATAGAVFAAQTSYVVTVTGVFWAMLLMDERFPPLVWLALVVMLAGVALVRPRDAAAARA